MCIQDQAVDLRLILHTGRKKVYSESNKVFAVSFRRLKGGEILGRGFLAMLEMTKEYNYFYRNRKLIEKVPFITNAYTV